MVLVESNEKWVREEGGVEGATHIETIEEECQQRRIKWLCDNAVGKRVLELGCNWGYILNAVCMHNKRQGVGIDINPDNISKAQTEYPRLKFITKDICKTGYFGSFNTVMLPDVLEHLPERKVSFVVEAATRAAKDRVLITLPLEEKKKNCFKHRWIVSDKIVQNILGTMKDICKKTSLFCDRDFYYLRGDN